MKHIRNLYEQLGVDNYYKDYGNQYKNPHLAQIQELILRNATQLDYSAILDFCGGGGEVSLIIQQLGYDQITGSDPYTHQLYKKNLNQDCHTWSFDDVIKGKLIGNYSSIICSFAMHLCPEEKLYPLVIQLFQHSNNLIILTPHKRPILEQLNGVELRFVDYALTEKGKKVFLKHYTYRFN
ncbi:class I SAM-dependent methyltransferase [Aureispira anguillae]|uniref:Class I SAM-dependent methyltransferase n=1 Tax=Aureispira anguillae TaxID=2864201 RepID=A0A916DQC1_9BACT|nr:class I SAM-dependent methyltransferase [Aureispira anguillae]BDS10641.1 class I SAM-dependent methyltransferase [Aureispira anguillae]